MLNKENFKEMESYLKEEDSQRELIIGKSRTILKNSKSAIYSLHRGEIKEAKILLDDAEKIIEELKKIALKHPHLKGNLDNGLQEYCEASCFYGFIKNKKIPTSHELKLDPFNYLSGLSDLTGELGRKAVIEATAKKTKEVETIREIIDEIHGHFIKFDLRNGELRKKSDSIKWNLQKVEELLYDLKRKR